MSRTEVFVGIFIFLSVVLIVGLLVIGTMEDKNKTASENIGSGITRVIDREANVVCWKYSDYNKGGVSCLPLSQTNLSKE